MHIFVVFLVSVACGRYRMSKDSKEGNIPVLERWAKVFDKRFELNSEISRQKMPACITLVLFFLFKHIFGEVCPKSYNPYWEGSLQK